MITNDDAIARAPLVKQTVPTETHLSDLVKRGKPSERIEREAKANRALNNEAHGATLELIEDLERIKAQVVEGDCRIDTPEYGLFAVSLAEAIHKATMDEIEFRRLAMMNGGD